MKQKWIVLIIICIGVFMSTLDGSILNIANPTIAADFKINMSQIQWVVTAYMLVVTATMLFFGKLGDKVGSNRLYTLGFFIFTIGSFLCSMSNNLSTINFFKNLSGSWSKYFNGYWAWYSFQCISSK